MSTQQTVKLFCEAHGLTCPPEHRALDLVSEIGEVAKEILKSTDYGTKERENREELKGELGDVYFALLQLANMLNIDLEDALKEILEKYQRRLTKGSAGSESE